ncbi:SMI1/KNR4 family protein [Streptomyces sp. B22F1]|uniref:SMI1/KNR4 family protein n=1 Tax=Streptomyces sp. B22F1 TaxID=3153566 RepID=UPI00325C42A1
MIMQGDVTEVMGLPLPEPLTRALREGRWAALQESPNIADVFADEPDGPMFYDIEAMISQNRTLHAVTDAQEFPDHPLMSAGFSVVPRLTLFIGDLGADMPFALDYRLDMQSPRVIYLGPQGWVEVARNIEELIARLQPPA